MHPLAQVVRIYFILILEFATHAAQNAHLAFIIHQLIINVQIAEEIMILTEISAKLTARIQVVAEEEVEEDAIVMNKMVASDKDAGPLVAHNVIYHVKSVMEAVQTNVMTVTMDQL